MSKEVCEKEDNVDSGPIPDKYERLGFFHRQKELS
jgi:hypothetical protein